MKYDKAFLRQKYLLKRKNEYLRSNQFKFGLIFNFIKKKFKKKKIIIAGYYPSNYEANVMNFLQSFIDLIENSGISNHRRACSGMGNRVTVRMLDVVRLNAGLQIRYHIPVPMAAKGAMAFNIVALIA